MKAVVMSMASDYSYTKDLNLKIARSLETPWYRFRSSYGLLRVYKTSSPRWRSKKFLKFINNSCRENKGNQYREGGLDMLSYAPRTSNCNPPLSVLIPDETLFVVFYISL